MLCFDWLVLSSFGFGSSLFRCTCCVSILHRGYPCFRNFYFTIPVDVVRVNTYVNRLFDSACVPMRITINKLYFVPQRAVSGVVACSETGEVWVRASRMSLLHRSSSLADLNLDVASTYPTITLAFILNHPNTIRYTAMHDDTLHCTALQCNVVKLKILTPALRSALRSIIIALPPRTTLTSQPNLLIRGKGHKKPSCSTYTIITV